MEPPELLNLLVRSLARTDTDRPLPLRLCQACVSAFQAQGGALTVAYSDTPEERVAVSTPGVFERLEPLQEVLGEGPVHQALAEDRLVVMHLGAVADEYPVFSQLAGSVAADVTLYAVPMRPGGRVVGVLSLYVATDPHARDVEELQFMANALGAFLQGDVEPLDWSERAVFHQAIGMVVAQLGVNPDDASAVIRAHAFSRSASLLSVAQGVVDRRLTFSHEE
jgi:hypothetical protein